MIKDKKQEAARLYIAGPHSPEAIAAIEAQFTEKLNQAIRFEVEVDESLLGGFIALIDGRLYDASLKTELSDSADVRIYDYGEVVSSSDSVVLIKGLKHSRFGEKIAFEGEAYGLVMHLDRGMAGVILLNGSEQVRLGSLARSTGEVIEMPVGPELLGRIVDPLGHPLDAKSLEVSEYRPIETAAPSIIDRGMVSRPLQTGILAIDSMIPIGRGQRELIIGDRQSGKTSIALDSILNQKAQDVICIYVAIGQKLSSVTRVYNELAEAGALDYTSIIVAPASSSAAMQYIAPYAGAALAESFMYKGRDVLIVYDDLSKHAIAYRTISLLLKRPPGREAYPGDVFYLHSRLLERAAQLSEAKGGGSMTALPIVETLAGDISAYIPTNIISITDGQVYLESELFHAGIRPAINVGLSVSRVGGAAQTTAIRKLAQPLRLSLAQYRELKIFTQFGSDIDPATKQRLDYGSLLTNVLIQKRGQPLPLSAQVSLLLAATLHHMNQIPLDQIQDYKQSLLSYLRLTHTDDLADIDQSGLLAEAARERLIEAIASYQRNYIGEQHA